MARDVDAPASEEVGLRASPFARCAAIRKAEQPSDVRLGEVRAVRLDERAREETDQLGVIPWPVVVDEKR